MFVHSGWLHLIGNMIFLWVFGDNVEDRLGILPFLGIYLLTGLAASAAQVASAPASTIPIVGASGALSGVAGVYLVLFPRARVRVLLPIFVFVRIIEVSALAFFVIWFLLQAVQGWPISAGWAMVGWPGSRTWGASWPG